MDGNDEINKFVFIRPVLRSVFVKNASSQSHFDNPLSENRTFNSKEQIESSKSILVMIYKQRPRCFWRLYVVCPKGSTF
jgi:hypothetical protein